MRTLVSLIVRPEWNSSCVQMVCVMSYDDVTYIHERFSLESLLESRLRLSHE